MTLETPSQSQPAQALDEARRAYEAGDYARFRADLKSLLAASPPEEVRREAEALLGRVRPDRAAIVLAIACLVFFVLVVLRYVA